MTAIYKKELKSYYTGGIGYVFTAFTVALAGIFTMVYNLSNRYYANFEYTVCAMVFYMYLLLIPILTMKVIAEERKQKTDKLLYSLPLKMSQIVLGKYLAAVTVLGISLLLVGMIPLVLCALGDVPLKAAYASLFALFMLGCALIAVGVFISSLTESMIVSAVVTLIAVLLNYLVGYLAEYVSSSAAAGAAVLIILILIIGFALSKLTQNKALSIGGAGILAVATAVIYFVKSEWIEGLCPTLLEKAALFSYLDEYANGLFDLRAICVYASVAAVFVYLTVQSMEKRRWA